jgi:ribose 5-phosphate isomerase B
VQIALGSDHAGYRYKELFKRALIEDGHDVIDVGVTTDEAPADYPEISEAVARKVDCGEAERGVIVAGSGNGEAIVANRFHGIRAAVCNDVYTAEMSRRHNDANVLCLGQRVVGEAVALKILETWLAAPFDGGRHAQRLATIVELEDRLKKEYGG